jgi:gliding motility-associated-like protein
MEIKVCEFLKQSNRLRLIRKAAILLFLLFTFHNAVSQNLVPNPGFELYSGAINGAGDFTGKPAPPVTSWMTLCGTPDWHDTLNNPMGDILGALSPGNSDCDQGTPHSGSAVLGLVASFSDTAVIAERVKVQLSSPMMPGTLYKVSFWIRSASNSGYPYGYCQCNNWGIYFSVTNPFCTYPNPLPWNTMQYVRDTNIVGENNLGEWEYKQWFFCPNQAYQYLALGITGANLLSEMKIIIDGGGMDGRIYPYVHIDDLVVEPASASWTSPGTICTSSSPIDLRKYITGDTGGVFSGPGIIGNTNYFNPSGLDGQTVTINYSLSSDSCKLTVPNTIKIGPLAAPTIGTITQPTCTIPTGTVAINNLPSIGIWTLTWNNGSAIGTDSTYNVAGLSSGTSYIFKVSNSTGCISSASNPATINIKPPTPQAAISASSDKIFTGESIQLSATNDINYIYNWTPSVSLSCTTCSSTIATPITTTTYSVEITNSEGCSDSASIRVEVVPCQNHSALAIPNAFSPNGDNQNDYFVLKGWSECLQNFTISIFDRWGEKVFESSDPNFSWDGTYKQKTVDSGVFVCVVNAMSNGVKIERTTNITLIR